MDRRPSRSAAFLFRRAAFPMSLSGDPGGHVRNRLHHGVPDAGIVERMAGALDATDFGAWHAPAYVWKVSARCHAMRARPGRAPPDRGRECGASKHRAAAPVLLPAT